MTLLTGRQPRPLYLAAWLMLCSVVCTAGAAVAGPVTAAAPVIRFDGDGLTVRVRDMPLDELLGAIADRSGLDMIRYTVLDGRISVDFERLPLRQALRRVLRGHSFLLDIGRTETDATGPATRAGTVWVLPRAGEPLHRPGRSLPGRYSPDAAARADAVADIGTASARGAAGELELALLDPDREVREAAILTLAEQGDDTAAATLALALSDEDAGLRELAVDALADIGGPLAVTLLHQALGDNAALVREAAAEGLDQLTAGRE